jgi:cytochrome P450
MEGETMAAPAVQTLLRELSTHEGRRDPYPRYEAIRSATSIAQAADGRVMVLSYAGCTAVVRDPSFAHHPQAAMAFAFGRDWKQHLGLRQMFSSLLAQNPPNHTRLRSLVASAFSPRRVQQLRPAVQALLDAALDDMQDRAEGGQVDYVDTFAFPLPVNVIGELLGIPAEDRAQFQTLVRDATQVLEVLTPAVILTADAAAKEIRDYLAGLVAERRRQPRGDLLSALVEAEQRGDRLTEDELLTTAALLLSAGFETTVGLLGNGLVALAENPDQRALLAGDPSLADAAVEELLRYDAPVQSVQRLVVAPVEIDGVPLQPGTRVTGLVGAANRDPARFPRPNELDLRRADNAPLSFGGGIHFCLGAALARLEGRLAFPALLQRFPDLAVNGPAVRRDSLTLHNFTSIPVSLTG